MTAREFARRLEEPYTTVAGWLQRDLVPGATYAMVGTFKVWVVPADAVETVAQWRPKPGRPPLTDEEKTARAKQKVTKSKKKVGGSQASLFEPATTAKPARKTVAKKTAKRPTKKSRG